MENLERAANVAYTAAYLAAVGVLLLTLMPGIRLQLERLARLQVHAWKHGRWLERQPRPPAFVRHLDRPDLPQETWPGAAG